MNCLRSEMALMISTYYLATFECLFQSHCFHCLLIDYLQSESVIGYVGSLTGFLPILPMILQSHRFQAIAFRALPNRRDTIQFQ